MVVLSQAAGAETCSPTGRADTATRRVGETWEGCRARHGGFPESISESISGLRIAEGTASPEAPVDETHMNVKLSFPVFPLLSPLCDGQARPAEGPGAPREGGVDLCGGQTICRYLCEEAPPAFSSEGPHSFSREHLHSCLSGCCRTSGGENCATLDSGNLLSS